MVSKCLGMSEAQIQQLISARKQIAQQPAGMPVTASMTHNLNKY